MLDASRYPFVEESMLEGRAREAWLSGWNAALVSMMESAEVEGGRIREWVTEYASDELRENP